MNIQFVYHPDNLLPISERGSMANKALLQFHIEVHFDDKVAYVLKGLRVGAGQLFDACGRGGKGNKYHSIIAQDAEILIPTMQPIFEDWAKQYPTVEFPKEVKKRTFIKAGGHALGSEGISVLKKAAVRPFHKKSISIAPAYDPANLLEYTDRGIIFQGRDSRIWFNCSQCEDGQNVHEVSMDDALTRICPKCQLDLNKAKLIYGINDEGILVDNLDKEA